MRSSSGLFSYKKHRKRLLLKYSRPLLHSSFLLRHGFLGLFTSESATFRPPHIRLIASFFASVLRKRSKMWYNMPLSFPLTKKPTGSRMGKGIGGLFGYSMPVSAGFLVAQFAYGPRLNIEALFRLLKIFSKQLPCRTIIRRF